MLILLHVIPSGVFNANTNLQKLKYKLAGTTLSFRIQVLPVRDTYHYLSLHPFVTLTLPLL